MARRLLSVLALSLAVQTVHGAAAEWRPDRAVEIVATSGPGGANDVIARSVQRLMQQKKLVTVPLSVVNKVGGGGVLGWAYLNQHPGDAHFISVSPVNLLIEHILGASTITHTDVTPLAQLFSEYVAFEVRTDSALRSGRELLDRLKADPGALSFAIAASLGGANHIATMQAMKAAGVDPRKLKFVVFASGPQALTAVLGGHVDVAVVPVSGAAPPLQAARVRVLAVSSARRMGGAFAAIPTWKEQGVDAVYSSWRGMIGPKGLSDAQIAYWEDVITRMVQSDDWKKEMETNYWESNFMNSSDARKFLKSQYDEYKSLLADVGLAK